MKKYLFIVLLVGVFGCKELNNKQNLIIHSPESSGFSSELLLKMKDNINGFVDDGKIPFVQTAIVKDNKLIHFDSYGFADIKSERKVKNNSIFRIASMTKPIISVAVMILNENGYIKLDDPISKHMKHVHNLLIFNNEHEFQKPKNEITIIDLLRHTSGLGSNSGSNKYIDSLYSNIKDLNTNKEFVEKLFSIPLFFEPSTDWKYGFSTDVLGRLIEKVSGQSLYAFLYEKIFKPLDMNDTHFQLPEYKIDRFVSVYSFDEQKQELLELSEWNSAIVRKKNRESGGRGLISTTADYINFCMMLSNNGVFKEHRILSEKSVDSMIQNQINDLDYPWGAGVKFGYGFSIVMDHKISDLIDSDGSYGWSGIAGTHFSIDPEKNMILILMTQRAWPYSGVWKMFNDMAYGALIRQGI